MSAAADIPGTVMTSEMAGLDTSAFHTPQASPPLSNQVGTGVFMPLDNASARHRMLKARAQSSGPAARSRAAASATYTAPYPRHNNDFLEEQQFTAERLRKPSCMTGITGDSSTSSLSSFSSGIRRSISTLSNCSNNSGLNRSNSSFSNSTTSSEHLYTPPAPTAVQASANWPSHQHNSSTQSYALISKPVHSGNMAYPQAVGADEAHVSVAENADDRGGSDSFSCLTMESLTKQLILLQQQQVQLQQQELLQQHQHHLSAQVSTGIAAEVSHPLLQQRVLEQLHDTNCHKDYHIASSESSGESSAEQLFFGTSVGQQQQHIVNTAQFQPAGTTAGSAHAQLLSFMPASAADASLQSELSSWQGQQQQTWQQQQQVVPATSVPPQAMSAPMVAPYAFSYNIQQQDGELQRAQYAAAAASAAAASSLGGTASSAGSTTAAVQLATAEVPDNRRGAVAAKIAQLAKLQRLQQALQNELLELLE